MKKSVWLILFGLALVTEPALAEVGIGVCVGYPVGPLGLMAEQGLVYVEEPIFFGGLIRFQSDHGAGGLEAEVLSWPGADMLVLHADGTLTARLAFIRLGIGVGFNLVRLSPAGYEPANALSPDLTTRLGLKFGSISAGIGFSMPVNLLARAIIQDTPIVKDEYDFMRLFAGQLTANITYWL